MSFIEKAVYKTGIYQASGLCFGDIDKVWLFDCEKSAVVSVDLITSRVNHHFADKTFCTFSCFNGFGAIGTLDGKMLLFDLNVVPHISTILRFSNVNAVGSIDYDIDSDSFFVLCDNYVLRSSRNGNILSKWRNGSPSFCIKWNRSSQSLWSISTGIEIMSTMGVTSVSQGERRSCSYTDVAISNTGDVACIGGDVDVFNCKGELITSICGDYNHGVFDPTGRLIVQEVMTETPSHVVIKSYSSYEVVSMCDCFALDQGGNRLAAMDRGNLHLFSRKS